MCLARAVTSKYFRNPKIVKDSKGRPLRLIPQALGISPLFADIRSKSLKHWQHTGLKFKWCVAIKSL